jgi:integrase/recombinase XerD
VKPVTSARKVFNSAITEITLGDALDAFIEVGCAQTSQETIKWYRVKLAHLIDGLGRGCRLCDVMEGDLLEWAAGLEGSVFSIHGYIRSTRRLFRWLQVRGVLEYNPASVLGLPRLPQNGKKGISEKDLRAILESAKGHVRDYAVLRFLESTGCRVGGIESLRLSDMNFDSEDIRLRRRVTVREKGGKVRSVFLTQGALAAMEVWLDNRPTVDNDFVFLSNRLKPLANRSVYDLVQKYAFKVGAKRWNPHEWRHRFARRLLERGMDLARVSQLMGHSTVQVTVAFYGQFAADQLQEGFDAFMENIE